MSKPKRPRDTNQLAKRIVDEAIGVVGEEDNPSRPAKHASKAGKKGGPARAKALTPEQRSEIAKLAAQARWTKS